MYKRTSTKPQKEKVIENISDYAANNIVHSFYKERSPNSVVIVDDIDDPWFKYVITYRTKSGVITDTSMIIAGDLTTWISSVQRMGFKLKLS